MSEDVPRNRVVWDEHLLTLATHNAPDARTVSDLLPRPVARRYTDDLLDAHARGSETPVSRLPRPLTQGQGNVTRHLREVARACADRLAFAPELLSRKRDVESCFRHFEDTGQLSEFYRGWRFPLVGEKFTEVLSKS